MDMMVCLFRILQGHFFFFFFFNYYCVLSRDRERSFRCDGIEVYLSWVRVQVAVLSVPEAALLLIFHDG